MGLVSSFVKFSLVKKAVTMVTSRMRGSGRGRVVEAPTAPTTPTARDTAVGPPQ